MTPTRLGKKIQRCPRKECRDGPILSRRPGCNQSALSTGISADFGDRRGPDPRPVRPSARCPTLGERASHTSVHAATRRLGTRCGVGQARLCSIVPVRPTRHTADIPPSIGVVPPCAPARAPVRAGRNADTGRAGLTLRRSGPPCFGASDRLETHSARRRPEPRHRHRQVGVARPGRSAFACLVQSVRPSMARHFRLQSALERLNGFLPLASGSTGSVGFTRARRCWARCPPAGRRGVIRWTTRAGRQAPCHVARVR